MTGVVPMSVRRLIVEIDPASINVTEFCEAHGISRWFFYDLRRRYAREGKPALEPKSTAPHTIKNKTPATIEDRIVAIRKDLIDEGWDAGADSIRERLKHELGAGQVPSRSTIWRILVARGFVIPEPKKRPRPPSRRFERSRANELWQLDGTDRALANGEITKVLNVIDDTSRTHIAGRVHPEETRAGAWDTICHGINTWGPPEEVLSDNAAGFHAIEPALAALGISMTHSRPGHPQTCGKVERFHQTMHRWLDARPDPETHTGLQALIDEFSVRYNNERPHRAIGRVTPASKWETLPKSGPSSTPITTPSTVHTSIADRQGRVTAGRQIRIALGRSYAHQPAITIINTTTAHTFIHGQLIRSTRLDPDRNYYPLNHPNL